MSRANCSTSPGKKQNLKSSGPNNLLPPSKKQRSTTSQGNNRKKKVRQSQDATATPTWFPPKQSKELHCPLQTIIGKSGRVSCFAPSKVSVSAQKLINQGQSQSQNLLKRTAHTSLIFLGLLTQQAATGINSTIFMNPKGYLVNQNWTSQVTR